MFYIERCVTWVILCHTCDCNTDLCHTPDSFEHDYWNPENTRKMYYYPAYVISIYLKYTYFRTKMFFFRTKTPKD